MAASLLAFLAVSAVVIVSPGQDTLLTIRNAFRGAGTATALGVSVGQACWTAAASAGIAALLVASEPVFAAVKLAGAAYLLYLGLTSLWSAFHGHGDDVADGGPALSRLAGFRQGLLSNLGNPKMAVFFTSLLPQFGGTSFAHLLALGLVFCGLTFAWLSVVARLAALLRRPRVRRVLDAVAGVVLTAAGVRIAADRG